MAKGNDVPMRERLSWAQNQGMAASEAIRAAFDTLLDLTEARAEGTESLHSVAFTKAEGELPSVHFAGGASVTGDGPKGRTVRREPRETEEKAHRIEVGVARGMMREHHAAVAFCVFEALYALSRGKGKASEARRTALDRWQVLGKSAARPESAAARDLAKVPPSPETVLGKAWEAASAALREVLGDRGFAGVNPTKKAAREGARYVLKLAGGSIRFPAASVPQFLKVALQTDAAQAELAVTLTLRVGEQVHAVDGVMERTGRDAGEPAKGEPAHGPVMTPTEGVIAGPVAAAA